MVARRVKDIAASVHQRLLNESRRTGKPFNALLEHYALERFLYRLSKTEHAKRLVLKGGLLLIALEGTRSRATRDADFSSVVHLSHEQMRALVSEVCDLAVAEDGLQFDSESLSSETEYGSCDSRSSSVSSFDRSCTRSANRFGRLWPFISFKFTDKTLARRSSRSTTTHGTVSYPSSSAILHRCF